MTASIVPSHAETAASGAAIYRRLLAATRPYRGVFAMAIVALLALSGTEWMLPWLLQQLIDTHFGAPVTRTALLLPVGLVGLFVLRGVLSYVGSMGLHWVAHRVVMDFRTRMFARIVDLPVAYFAHHAAGELVSKFTFDATQVAAAVTKCVTDFVKDATVILVLAGWLAWLNWQLTVVLFAVAPAIAWVIRRVSKRMRTMSQRLQTSIGGINRVAEEAILGHREIRMNGTAAFEQERFRLAANRARQSQMKVIGTAYANVPIVQLCVAVGIALMITMALHQGADGSMTRGEFVAFVTATLLLIPPAKRLSSLNEHLQRGIAAALSLFALIDEAPEPDPATGTLGEGSLGVALEHVTVQYEDRDQPALDDVSLQIAPGETVAIVGSSGSGKSTLLDLLPRLLPVTHGTVRIGGEDVNALSLDALRERIAVVSQHVVLFNETIAYNIGYGVPEGPDREARIAAAAVAAQVTAFTDELPDGLDTPVGDRGLKVSGGQRQRIALARALAKQAPILMLDEATSALDSVTERAVKNALDRIHGTCTLIIVAHRLTTVESADRIIVLERGRVVETGSHDDLMARRGAFAALHDSLARADAVAE